MLTEYPMVFVKEVFVFGRKIQYLGFYWNTLENIENPKMPSDRARLVTLATALERLKHLAERIGTVSVKEIPVSGRKTQ